MLCGICGGDSASKARALGGLTTRDKTFTDSEVYSVGRRVKLVREACDVGVVELFLEASARVLGHDLSRNFQGN